CRRACRPARERRETVRRPVVAVIKCRRHPGFHHSRRHHCQCRDCRRARSRPCHRHHRFVVVGRSRHQERDPARHRGEVGQHEPRRQSARRRGQARRQGARREFRHRDRRDASSHEGRCALRHRADAGPGRRGRARRLAGRSFGARPRRHHRRAQARPYRLRLVARQRPHPHALRPSRGERAGRGDHAGRCAGETGRRPRRDQHV
ncbi:hypothetical protein KXV85_002805, partial [Aspergillus fumigatus]